MSLLEVRGLDVHYGDLQALFGVDVIVDVGDTLAVIGANGAGKSTLLRTIAGQHRQTRGEVLFDGQRRRCPARTPARAARHRPDARRDGGCSPR